MKKSESQSVKTSISLPEDLWKQAKHLAIEDGTDLQDVITKALGAYLKQRSKKGGEEK